MSDTYSLSPACFQAHWTDELERHLEDLGFGKGGVAAETVGLLLRGGVREEHLRGEGAEQLLRELGVPIGARRAILARYGAESSTASLTANPRGFSRTGGWEVDSLMSARGGVCLNVKFLADFCYP